MTYDEASHEIKISILSDDFAPTKDHRVCLAARLKGTEITKVECFRVLPNGFDPTDPSNLWDDYQDDKDTKKANDNDKDEENNVVDNDFYSSTTLVVDEDALKEQWMKELQNAFPTEVADKIISTDEEMSFWIDNVSPTG